MTTAGRLVMRDQATESHFATPGLFNVTSEGVGEAGHAASKEYRHVIDMTEAGAPLDKKARAPTRNS
ncbi:hypothetical protein N7536_004185 [Penicillium majusculum]|nr:hypothetical protein N7536_004185 [Penicillium majusculum]